MRQAPSSDRKIQEDKTWKNERYKYQFIDDQEIDKGFSFTRRTTRVSNSLSGNERNHFFLNEKGNFTNLSLISGAADINDSRSFATLDYDQDGWTDIALMNLNEPRFRLMKNQMGKHLKERPVIRFKLQGTESNRDAIGTKITITYADGKKMAMHRQAGRGFAAQNSATFSIANPIENPLRSIELIWPNGQTTSYTQQKLKASTVLREPETQR